MAAVSASVPAGDASVPARDAGVRWTDDHCHLWLDDENPEADWAHVAEVVAAARDAGVARLISVGTGLATSAAAVEAAARHADVWATVGLHPHDARLGLDGFEALLHRPKVVAVGECGLDYHYDHSPRAVQRDVFAAQIELAHRHDLALVVHTRDAWDDTFAVLDAEGVPARTVIHCFTGGVDEVDACLERGANVSFSGIVTFRNATDVQAAAVRCPLDRLLVETDSPFLAPVPNRGKPNQPAWVPLVGEAIAMLRGCDVADVATASWENASRVYRLGDSLPRSGVAT